MRTRNGKVVCSDCKEPVEDSALWIDNAAYLCRQCAYVRRARHAERNVKREQEKEAAIMGKERNHNRRRRQEDGYYGK